MAAIRVPLSVFWATIVSIAMFYVLERLVAVHQEYTPHKAVEVHYTRKIVDTPVEPKREAKVERAPPTVVPPGPGLTTASGPALEWSAPASLDPGVTKHDGHTLALVDRDVQPLVRVEPDYPLRAREQNLEGWVQVQFTVTATGTVRDAAVVAAEPPGVFDAAALKAVARWRYSPRIDAGEAVERVGLQTVFRFQLDH